MLTKDDIIEYAIIVDDNYWTLANTPELGLEIFIDEAESFMEANPADMSEVWKIAGLLINYYNEYNLWGVWAMDHLPHPSLRDFLNQPVG
jgi:hypothetical protein